MLNMIQPFERKIFLQIKRYKRDFEYSYTLGVFPTIELLKYKLENVVEVIFSSKGENNNGVDKIKEICKINNIETRISDKAINRVSQKENVYAIGVFKKYKENIREGNHLMLVNPSDMGNLGTIIRTSLGLGIEDVAIISPGVDKFDPKVIRGSMGALFRVRIEYFDSFEEYTKQFKENKGYSFILGANSYLDEIEKVDYPYTLIFGNESSGLDEEYYKKRTNSIKIRQTDKIDSLNLAISIGIALYEFTKSIDK